MLTATLIGTILLIALGTGIMILFGWLIYKAILGIIRETKKQGEKK